MAKKKLTKKQRFSFKKVHVLWMIVTVLIILQGVSIWHIIKLREYAQSDSDFITRTLLKDAEENRYKYPVIDIAENRVYIPEARIYLPLNDTSRDLRYDYRDQGASSWPKAIYFSVSSIVGKQVNEQHASCDKMAILATPTQVQLNDAKQLGTIELTKDELSVVFENTDNTCWDQKWYTDAKQKLTETILQAKTY